jgi:hypothetical protein
MTDEQKEKFLAQAEKMGHSRTHLQGHGHQESTVTVNDIETLRKIVRPLDPESAQKREEHIQQVAKDRPRTMEEHIESYLFGTGDLSTLHVRDIQKGFPVTVQLVSEDERTLPHGETVVGPSGPPEAWNIGILRFYSDSFLTVKNNYFTLTAQNLVMQYKDPK